VSAPCSNLTPSPSVRQSGDNQARTSTLALSYPLFNSLFPRLTAIANGVLSRNAVDTRLQDLLLGVDDEVRAQRGIEPLLRLLDASRQPLSSYFRGHLHSEIAAKALTLKVLNLCLSKYHFLARDSALLSRPYGLIVDSVNNCNLACPGCVHSRRSKELHLFEWNAGFLSEERYAALLRRYGPYAIQVTLCNYGEPLVNPHTPRFIRMAKAYLLRTMLSTNMAVKRFDAEAYAASGLDFMTLSIDGATQPVYEKYRKKGDLDLVLRNIASLVEARRQSGRRSPVLNWQFLAFEHNAHEIEAALALARSLGVDQFTVASPFDVSWDDPSVRPARVPPVTHQFHTDSDQRMMENWNPFPEDNALAEIGNAFEASWLEQITPEHRAIRREPRARRTCHYLYKNMVMDANGRILPCCAAPRPDADLVFSIFAAGGPESFNSEKYRLARLAFSSKAAYQAERAGANVVTDPHCVKCDWYSDQATAHVDRAQIGRYLQAAGPQVFDTRSTQILTSW
jgi:MoaA/NifB/PqqE/SkfB family radical SAM enzyme